MKRTIVGVGMAIFFATTAVVSGPVRTLAAGACTVWTDPANDEQSLIPGQAGPQNDLIQGTMSADTRAEILIVRIHVANMSLSLPVASTGEDWSMFYAPSTTVYGYVGIYAAYDGTTFTYSDGGSSQPDTGTVVLGPDGYIEIDVPFAHLGISRGSVLSLVSAWDYVQAVPGVDALSPADSTSHQRSYTVGAAC